MSPTSGHDGRIDLDRQRQHAKALLRDLRAGQAQALQRLHAQAPHGLGHPPRLADCQWLLARELGFASWPKLKAHVEAIAFAARHPDFASGDEAACLHLRCGNDIAHSLELAGFRGEFRMFADPLSMGPVPVLPEESFRQLRAAFAGQAFDIPAADALRRTKVWLFSSGPLGDAALTPDDVKPVPHVRKAMERVGALGHVTFGGRLTSDATGFPASAMAKKMAGDWRDEESVRLWAKDIASA